MLAVLPPRLLLLALLPGVLQWLLQAAGRPRSLAWAVSPTAASPSSSCCCCARLWSLPCLLWLLRSRSQLLCLPLLPQLRSCLLLLLQLLTRLSLLPLLGSSHLLGWLCLALLPLLQRRLLPWLLHLLWRRPLRLLAPLRLLRLRLLHLRLRLQLIAQQLSLQALPLTNLTLQGVQQHI